MRILSGKYKFKKINIYKNINFNPISSFLKNNIFNILENKVNWEESVVVDLFFGTGSLGLESLSKNSKFVYFNDVNNDNCKILEKLLISLNDKNNEVNNLNYYQFLLKIKQINKKIDIIFLDPPFKKKEIVVDVLEILDKENLMNKNGFIIILSPIKREFDKFKNLELVLEKKYSKNFVYFLKFNINKNKTKENEFNNSKILIISGPSGVGKKQIIKNLINKKELNLFYSISTTTRNMRIDEINKKDYNFVSTEYFEEKINSNSFLEYAKFLNNYYGTLKSTVKELQNKNKNVLLEIEIIGALEIKKKIPNAIWVYIFPPTIEDLKIRLKKRGTESKEQIEERFSKAKKEIRFISTNNYCDLQVFNIKIEDTTNEIFDFLKFKFKNEI